MDESQNPTGDQPVVESVETVTVTEQETPEVVKESPVTSGTTNKNQALKIGIMVGAIVAILVAAGVAAFLILKPDYKKTLSESETFKSELEEFLDDSACATFMTKAADVSVSEDKLESYIPDCQGEVKELNKKVKAIGETSGVKRDKEIKKLYEDFDNKWQTLIAGETGFEAELKNWSAIHSFLVNATTIDFNKNIDGMLELGDVLKNSSSESLKQYGEKWNSYVEKMIDISNRYKKATSTSEQMKLQSELIEVVNEFEEFGSKMEDAMNDLNFSPKNSEAFANAFENFYDAIEEKTK